MIIPRIIMCVFAVSAIAACTPSITLQPADVPSLYGDFSPVGTPVSELDNAQAARTESEIEAAEAVANAAGAVEIAAEQSVLDAEATLQNAIDEASSSVATQCAALQAELDKLNQALGTPAQDQPPSTPPTALQKAGKSIYDIARETVLGPVQVVIQSKRAIFGDAEKERLRAEAIERGNTRRGYLIGYAKAAGCDLEMS